MSIWYSPSLIDCFCKASCPGKPTSSPLKALALSALSCLAIIRVASAASKPNFSSSGIPFSLSVIIPVILSASLMPASRSCVLSNLCSPARKPPTSSFLNAAPVSNSPCSLSAQPDVLPLLPEHRIFAALWRC